MNKFGYTVIDVLGKGTFGMVYKCQDQNGNNCCIKKIQLNTSSEAIANTHYEQVKEEIYLLKNLKHPRIITMYSHFSIVGDNHMYIVMEYAEQGALAALLAGKRMTKSYLNEYNVIGFFIDVLLGIEFLHIKQVIHKDIKSENILIFNNGRLKIADFGVSKIANIDNLDLRTLLMTKDIGDNETGGTPYYMAPETLRQNPFTFASDMWAVGCILYELCMLYAPFSSTKTMNELIYYTERALYKPINFEIKLYSDKLISLCASMITPNPFERATIKDVISNNLIVRRYYQCYFDFGFGVSNITIH